MANAKTKQPSMLEGAPWRSILVFAIPIFFGSILQQLYHTVDTMMVGRLISQSALSSVGTCGVLTNLCLAFSTGFSVGTGVISGQLYGAGRQEDLRKNAYASIRFLMMLGLGICLLGFVLRRPLLQYIVSVPAELLEGSVTYFGIIVFGFLFQFIYNAAAALLRSVGDSKASLYFLTISSVTNIILDYVFLAWFDWGIAGAAWATVASQAAACLASYVYMQKKYDFFRFAGHSIKVTAEDYRLLLKTGFPIALQSMIGNVFNLMVQRLVNSFGAAMTASYTVVGRFEGYMHLPTNTINQALATYTAQNIGADRPERVQKGLAHALVMTVSVTGTLALLAYIFAPQIAAFFGIDGTSAAYCMTHIRTMTFGFLLFSAYFPCMGLYQGAGKGMVTTKISTAFLAVCLTIAYGLQYIPAIGYRSIFICKPLAWLIIAPCNYIYFFKGKWKEGKLV